MNSAADVLFYSNRRLNKLTSDHGLKQNEPVLQLWAIAGLSLATCKENQHEAGFPSPQHVYPQHPIKPQAASILQIRHDYPYRQSMHAPPFVDCLAAAHRCERSRNQQSLGVNQALVELTRFKECGML